MASDKQRDTNSEESDYYEETFRTSIERGGSPADASSNSSATSPGDAKVTPDKEKRKKKLITKRKRDENKNISPKKAKTTFDVNTTGAITSTPDNNAAVASTSSQGMKNKTIAENKPACGRKDVIINTTKPTRRVKRVRKKVPLLNETQMINAVKAALNEQPIIILPIFLGEDCNKTNWMCTKFWSNCYGLCTTQPPDCSMKVTIKCCNSVSSSRQNDTTDSTTNPTQTIFRSCTSCCFWKRRPVVSQREETIEKFDHEGCEGFSGETNGIHNASPRTT